MVTPEEPGESGETKSLIGHRLAGARSSVHREEEAPQTNMWIFSGT